MRCSNLFLIIALVVLTIHINSCKQRTESYLLDDNTPYYLNFSTPKTDKTTKDTYHANIEFYKFSNLSFKDLPRNRIPLPKDLRLGTFYIDHKVLGVKKPEDFLELVLEKVKNERKIDGDTIEYIRKLTASEALKLAIDITANNIEYYKIDHCKEWKDRRATDQILTHGYGDCDKYSRVMMYIFLVFKNLNPSLQNVYVDNDPRGHNIGHSWNRVVLVYPEKLIISHFDVTFYDTGGLVWRTRENLNAVKNLHLPSSKIYTIANFYEYIDSDYSFELYRLGLLNNSSKSEKTQMFAKMADIASSNHNESKQKQRETVINIYKRQDSFGYEIEFKNKHFVEEHDKVQKFIESLYCCALYVNDSALQLEFSQLLLKKYFDKFKDKDFKKQNSCVHMN